MDKTLDLIFKNGRTCRVWQKKSVDDRLLMDIYDLAKLGPTHANCCPMRIVFLKTDEAKEKLKPTLDPANVEKTMTAPVVAIIAYDPNFFKFADDLFPGSSAWFKNPDGRDEIGRMNAILQSGYLMMAARALGLDCGPMAGFNPQKVDEIFLKEVGFKSLLLCNLGYGDRTDMPPRGPRLDFETACLFS